MAFVNRLQSKSAPLRRAACIALMSPPPSCQMALERKQFTKKSMESKKKNKSIDHTILLLTFFLLFFTQLFLWPLIPRCGSLHEDVQLEQDLPLPPLLFHGDTLDHPALAGSFCFAIPMKH